MPLLKNLQLTVFYKNIVHMVLIFRSLKLIVFVLILLFSYSCSTFKEYFALSHSAKDKKMSQTSYGKNKPKFDQDRKSHLFEAEDFEDSALFETPDFSSDTNTLIESFDFADSTFIFSNSKMEDPRITQELLNESRALYMLDNLTTLKFFRDDETLFDKNKLNIYNYDEAFVPKFSDSVYQSRIEIMNRKTPLEFVYNETVKGYIDVYGIKKRGLSSRILGLAAIYFPMFEELLDQYNLPLELKYLAVVESALNPLAGSPAGAKGLWQFMYNTGKVYGLELNSYVDDRYDPYKSTIAACKHLKDLYDIYEDWWLVLAAYNSGAGNVNKAIRRSGGIKNYWAIWPFLPRETRGYVPAFIAVAYVMTHSAEHNLYPTHPGILYNAIDTVQVYDVLTFDRISEMIGISKENLKYLNPSFKEGVIPATKDNKYILRLPRTLTAYYVSKEEEIYKYRTETELEKEKLMAKIKEMPKYQIHIVKRGETLGGISRKYKTTVSTIQALNNLRGTTIHPGQKLYVSGVPSTNIGKSSAATASSNNTNNTIHVVKKGENLGLIASKYKCSVNDLKNWNNLVSNTIHVNQKLIVSKSAEAVAGTASQENQSTSESDGYIYYIVKPGDTLWEIAKQYNGVTVEGLKKLNNIKNTKALKVGQKIKITTAG